MKAKGGVGSTQRRRWAGQGVARASLLLAAGFAGWLGAALPAAAGSSYLAVWSSDKESDDARLNTDFLAIIDADPRAATYGKVVNTAAMERIAGVNLLNDLGFTGPLGLTTKYDLPARGIPSNVLNEAHHMSHEPVAVGSHRYLFLGGLISANIFRCDVADPLDVPACELVTTARDVRNFSGIDDIVRAPNGNLLVTYMGSKTLTTPGGVVELDLDGNVVAEHRAAKRGGPVRYRPNVDGISDTGLLAHPHGIDTRPDLDLMVTSDYAQPLSLATAATVDATTVDFGTTVRFWTLSELAAGPKRVIQLPVGRGREALPTNNAPEGVMAVAFTHRRGNRGVFVTTMEGGSIWYAPDATAAFPKFRLVYRVGPGAAPAVFTITPDDRYLLIPVQGVWRPGDAVYNRDYPGEHGRRVIALDIRKLLAARNDVACDAPPVQTDAGGTITRILARNNGAADCPTVSGELILDSADNFATRGGPHFIAFDHETRRLAVSNYFVQLTPFNLPGSHQAGDDRVCMGRLTATGALVLDTAFRDELSGKPCVSFDRPRSYTWPNHGKTGAAKPHGMAFIHVGDWQD